MEQDDVIEVYQEQTGGGYGWDTLDELPEEFFEIEARGPGDSRTLITVLPGMDYGDLKSEYCRKVIMCMRVSELQCYICFRRTYLIAC